MKKLHAIARLLFSALFIFLTSCSSNEETISSGTTPKSNSITSKRPITTSPIVDANATAETVAMFTKLKTLGQTKFAIGHQDAFNAFYLNASGTTSDVKKTTGNDPALLGSDFMFITDKNNDGTSGNWFYQQEQKIIADVKQAYDKGMINTFCWHLKEPFNEVSFYTADMTAQQQSTAFKSILPGGSNHNWYKLKLDKIASVVSNLRGSDGKLIPIIFRPFHEFDGSWFWWGANFCTAQEYKTAYQFTVDYLKTTKGVHNLLYAYSPDNSYTTSTAYLSRYPGDAYVDILGMDNYGDFNNQGQAGADLANAKLKMLSDLAISKSKIAALTETGYQVTATTPAITGWFSNYLYNALTANNIQISYVMFWYNTNNGYYVPTPLTTNADDFINFANLPKSTLINTLPSMYTQP
jgi:mannan endo-1,4-beta-mannosidase